MTKEQILIIEDDSDIVEMISYNLIKEGYKVLTAQTGETGLQKAQTDKVGLIILDLMLPGIDGLEICKTLRADTKNKMIPIIVVSAKSQETDKIIALELGADDYLSKPFSPRELIARIKALLRRTSFKYEPNKTIQLGFLSINPLKHKVTIENKAIFLTPTEFKLLSFLAKRCGIVLSREEILDNVFGYTSEIYDRTVDAHIKSLRRKFGKYRGLIETIRGIGYRINEPIDEK
ncbi:MAG: response regulator transcription factor [Candidatus Omnitrophica bacterium]|nr:response regulator transcription factor [Candidatus Omnitrophota bacterium]